MKKLFILAITLITFAASASALPDNPVVNSAILKAFNKTYSKASAIEWTVTKDFTRAKFSYEGEILYVYYNEEGDQMAVTRNIHSSQLPAGLASSLKTKYPEYYLADLFELSKDGETVYYATVRNQKCTMVLKASPSESWRIYKKQKTK